MFVINCCFFPLSSFSKATKYICSSCNSSCQSTTFCHYTLSVLLTLFCTQNELFVGIRLISMKKKGKSLIFITYLIPLSLKRLQAVACFLQSYWDWTHLQPTNNVVNPEGKRGDCFKSQGEWIMFSLHNKKLLLVIPRAFIDQNSLDFKFVPKNYLTIKGDSFQLW